MFAFPIVGPFKHSLVVQQIRNKHFYTFLKTLVTNKRFYKSYVKDCNDCTKLKSVSILILSITFFNWDKGSNTKCGIIMNTLLVIMGIVVLLCLLRFKAISYLNTLANCWPRIMFAQLRKNGFLFHFRNSEY